VGVRIATVFLVSTFLDDGIREIRSFHSQCEYLDTPANNFRLPHSVAVVYVLLSLTAQLVGGGYVLLCAFCSPNALTIPAIAGDTGWRFLRLAVTSLAAFVLSSINVYGIGQPASQHAQGRLVFLLRNGSMLGGVLLLIAAQQSSACMRQFIRLVARILLALHGLEVAPAEQVSVVALVDIACFPLTGLLIIGLFTRYAAPALALAVVVSDLTLNHFWYGFRYNDNIRYYFFEDLSLVGGLMLLAVTSHGENDVGLDSCRKGGKELHGRGTMAERSALLLDDEYEVD